MIPGVAAKKESRTRGHEDHRETQTRRAGLPAAGSLFWFFLFLHCHVFHLDSKTSPNSDIPHIRFFIAETICTRGCLHSSGLTFGGLRRLARRHKLVTIQVWGVPGLSGNWHIFRRMTKDVGTPSTIWFERLKTDGAYFLFPRGDISCGSLSGQLARAGRRFLTLISCVLDEVPFNT